MNWRLLISARRCRDVLAILALAALLLPTLAHAAAPPPRLPEVPGPPLFDPEAIQTDPTKMALVVFGATSLPGSGPYSSLAALYAGERTSAWSLEGPMTNRYTRVSVGVATLVGNGTAPAGFPGLSQLALLKQGELLNCWVMIDTDRFRGIPREWLNVVTDQSGIPVGGIEAEVYARVVVRAYYTSLAAFKKASRHDVTYTHVINEPERYRGTVMHVEGRLLRINRYDPPQEADLAGVSNLYEAWVANPELGANPSCLIFSMWPKELSRDLLGKPTIKQPIRVSFDGFFFKTYAYKSRDRYRTPRTAPLVIGHGLVVLSTGEEVRQASTGWIRGIMLGFLGVLLALMLGVVAITYWYRRSDNRIRQLMLNRMPEFALPAPDALPVAPPVGPSVKRVNGPSSHTVPLRSRITFPASGGDRGSGDAGGTEKKDKPPDEGAGGRPRP